MEFLKNKILILILCGVFCLAACGGTEDGAHETSWDDQTEYVSVVFHLDWESVPESSQLASTLARTYRYLSTEDLCTVTVTVYNGSGSKLAGKDFDYDAHHGTIQVTAGTNRKFVIEGKLCTGEIVYRGEKSGIDLKAGIRNDVGTITMSLDTTEVYETPKAPVFEDHFENLSLDNNWQVVSGDWQIKDGVLNGIGTNTKENWARIKLDRMFSGSFSVSYRTRILEGSLSELMLNMSSYGSYVRVYIYTIDKTVVLGQGIWDPGGPDVDKY